MRLSKEKLRNKLMLITSTLTSLRTKKAKALLPIKNMPKVDIFIWGCNEFSMHLYHLLIRHNINVLGFIENKAEQTIYCTKPLYTPQTFIAKKEFCNVPVVIASSHNMKLLGPSIDLESIRQFKLKFTEIINDYKIHNPLLHPSAMIDVSNCIFPKKIITFGMQGSGNTIYNHIFMKLIDNYINKFVTIHPDTAFFEKMCYEYEQCIKQIMTDAVYSIGGQDIMITPREVSYSGITFTNKGKKHTVYSLHTRDHITHRAYGYHKIPSMEVLDELTAREFKIFFMLRNPLDVILSIIKKRRHVDNETKKIDINAFHSISQLVVRQFTRWKPYFSKMEVLRYESLMDNADQQIEHVMRKLNLKPSSALAKSIWNELGFKPLPNAPKTHFGGGGAGKWEQFFKPEHLAFLCRIGIENILKDFGYLDVLETFQQKLKAFSQNDYRDIEINKPSPEFLYIADNIDESNPLEKTSRTSNTIESGCFHFISEDEMLLKKMQNSLNTEYIEKLIAAGTLTTREEIQQSIQTAI